MASSTSATWKAMPSSAARAMCAGVVPRVRPMSVPRGVRVPVRRAQADKRGHEYTPPVSGTLRRQRFHLGRGADEPQAIAQPLHHRAADEDAALERVLRPPLGAGRDGGDQLVLRARLDCVPMFSSRKQPVP